MSDPVPPAAPSAVPPVKGSTLPSSSPSAAPPGAPPTLPTLPPPSSSPPRPQDETSGIDGFFDDLSQQILVASHNGLFNVVNLLYKNRIDELMSAASESQTKKENEKFGTQVYEMRRIFDEAWNKAPQSWRILYERGMLHFLAIFASTYITFYCLVALGSFLEPRIPIWICGFGVCGAALQIIYYLVKQINRRLLRRVWIVQCFVAPVLGVLLSIAIYLAINGGLMVFGADKDKSSLNENIIALFCLYAGYKWEWALDKLNELVGAGKQG